MLQGTSGGFKRNVDFVAKVITSMIEQGHLKKGEPIPSTASFAEVFEGIYADHVTEAKKILTGRKLIRKTGSLLGGRHIVR